MWMSRPGQLVFLFFALPSLYGARLEVEEATVGSRFSSALAVQLRAESAMLASIQFDLEYPGDLVAVSVLPGASARNAFKQVRQNDLSPTTKRVLIMGMNRTTLEDGPVAVLHASAKQSIGQGKYAFRLVNLIAVDTSGNAVNMDGKNGGIEVDPAIAATPLSAGGVLNSASFLPGPVAPGELVTLLGAGFGESGTEVTFDDAPAPVLYAGASQINTIAPVVLGGETRIQVRLGATALASAAVGTAEVAPGVFSEDASGSGPAVALFDDGSRSSQANPAAPGSVLSIFATGLGQAANITAAIQGVEAAVLNVETLTGSLSGVAQVRIRIPDGVRGLALPLVIRAGGVPSQTGITVAVQ
jgi:uncharacterized protein (TIGR03437 family)